MIGMGKQEEVQPAPHHDGALGAPRSGPPLHYRPWRGQLRSSAWSLWPVARIALWMILRRKLFWLLYAVGLLFFFMFFFGQYLLAWTESQSDNEAFAILPGVKVKPTEITNPLRYGLKLDGSSEQYRNFFRYQASMVVIILAMAGSILVGNDFQFGSVPFYLSKPLSSWHYIVGKCLAVAVFINLMTTVPALVLFIQYGLLTSWDYFRDEGRLVVGILAYGLVLTICLSLILVATASWLRRTVPMIMGWMALFVFCRFLASGLVDLLHFSPRWRLIDLWNSTYLLGNSFLQGNYLLTEQPQLTWPGAQPDVHEAALVLGAVCVLCLTYLILRIRAVEIVR